MEFQDRLHRPVADCADMGTAGRLRRANHAQPRRLAAKAVEALLQFAAPVALLLGVADNFV
jgi:hypothetical protein